MPPLSRPLLLSALLACLGVSPARSEAPADLGTRSRGEDWTGFLGPTGDGKSRETGIRSRWEEAGPPLVWEVDVGTGYGGPSIARGRLFLFDRQGDRVRLRCLRSETGGELWRFEYPTEYADLYGYDNGPRTTPVVDADRVYILGPEGMLHCVAVADGKKIWEVDTTAKFGVVQNFFGVGSTPIVEGELLIAQIGGSPPGSPPIHSGDVRGNGSGIVAFDRSTGDVVYQVSDELASYASPCIRTIGERRWGFVFARGGLVAFAPATGKIDFHFPWRARKLESVNASNPVVVGDEVLISETYGPGSCLLRVRPGGYEVVWKDPPGRNKALQTHWNTAIHHRGFVYGCSGRHTANAELRCVEWSSGRVRWSVPLESRATLLQVDGHFVCLTEYGRLLLIRIDPARYAPVAGVLPLDRSGQPLLRYPAWAPPVLSHGLLYLRGKGRLACMELISGEE